MLRRQHQTKLKINKGWSWQITYMDTREISKSKPRVRKTTMSREALNDKECASENAARVTNKSIAFIASSKFSPADSSNCSPRLSVIDEPLPMAGAASNGYQRTLI
jgi:hypothetical protein